MTDPIPLAAAPGIADYGVAGPGRYWPFPRPVRATAAPAEGHRLPPAEPEPQTAPEIDPPTVDAWLDETPVGIHPAPKPEPARRRWWHRLLDWIA